VNKWSDTCDFVSLLHLVFHNMVTISPSEPLLAEAAYKTMATCTNTGDMTQALLGHIDSSYLNAGDRGEVIAALLLLLAWDKVMADPNRKKPFPADAPPREHKLEDDGGRRGRILTVLEFLDALIPTVDVRKSGAVRATEESLNVTLEKAFPDAYIWFNYFIKVHDFNVVNRQYLWRLIGRGAAVICANNHRGIDIVIPILFGNILKPECVSAIFIQVKNDKSFTANVRTALFTAMDPFNVGFFSKGEKAVYPIIRMVFALASNVSAVKVKEPVRRAGRSVELKKYDKFTAYDIWVAGVTNQSFGVISESEIRTYKSLLERSCKIFNGSDLIDKTVNPSTEQQVKQANARRRMQPGAASNIEHFEKYGTSTSAEELEFVVELDDSEDVDV
jgi:hypothetical protein